MHSSGTDLCCLIPPGCFQPLLAKASAALHSGFHCATITAFSMRTCCKKVRRAEETVKRRREERMRREDEKCVAQVSRSEEGSEGGNTNPPPVKHARIAPLRNDLLTPLVNKFLSLFILLNHLLLTVTKVRRLVALRTSLPPPPTYACFCFVS